MKTRWDRIHRHLFDLTPAPGYDELPLHLVPIDDPKVKDLDVVTLASAMAGKKDKAMSTVHQKQAKSALVHSYGGIDLNTANLNLRIKHEGQELAFPMAQEDMAQLNNLKGLFPVIVQIQSASQSILFSKLLIDDFKNLDAGAAR